MFARWRPPPRVCILPAAHGSLSGVSGVVWGGAGGAEHGCPPSCFPSLLSSPGRRRCELPVSLAWVSSAEAGPAPLGGCGALGEGPAGPGLQLWPRWGQGGALGRAGGVGGSPLTFRPHAWQETCREDAAGCGPVCRGPRGWPPFCSGTSPSLPPPPSPRVGVGQEGERGQRRVGAFGSQAEAESRQVFAEGSCAFGVWAQGSRERRAARGCV